MTGYGSLFERLGGDTVGRARLDHEVSVMASVAAHLAKMLSTRAGSVQTLPDYGLPDLNDMRLSLHDALQQARMAIERFIESGNTTSLISTEMSRSTSCPPRLAWTRSALINVSRSSYAWVMVIAFP